MTAWVGMEIKVLDRSRASAIPRWAEGGLTEIGKAFEATTYIHALGSRSTQFQSNRNSCWYENVYPGEPVLLVCNMFPQLHQSMNRKNVVQVKTHAQKYFQKVSRQNGTDNARHSRNCS